MANYTMSHTGEQLDTIIGKVLSLEQSQGQAEDKIMSQKSVTDSLSTKVDNTEGKGLSTNDYTTEEKTKLSGIETEANKTVAVQATGTSTTSVMSQNASSTLLALKDHTHTIDNIVTDTFMQYTPSNNTSILYYGMGQADSSYAPYDVVIFGAKYDKYLDNGTYDLYIMQPYIYNSNYMNYNIYSITSEISDRSSYGKPLYGISFFEENPDMPMVDQSYRVLTTKGVLTGKVNNPGSSTFTAHDITDDISNFKYKQINGIHVIYEGGRGFKSTVSNLYVSTDALTWTSVTTPVSVQISSNYTYITDIDYFNGTYYLSADGVWSTTDLTANSWTQIFAPRTNTYNSGYFKIILGHSKIVIPQMDSSTNVYFNYSADGTTWNKSSALSFSTANIYADIIYSSQYSGYIGVGGTNGNTVKFCNDDTFSTWSSLGQVNYSDISMPNIYNFGTTLYLSGNTPDLLFGRMYTHFANQKNVLQVKDGGTGAFSSTSALSNLGFPTSPASDSYTLKSVNGNLVWVDVAMPTVVQTTGTSTTDIMSQNATTIAINGKVEDSITDGHTTVAPSGNAVYDALALKAPLASPSFTGIPTGVLQTFSVTLPYASWTGSSAPYTKAVTVTGILATDKPNIDLDLSSTEYANVATIQSAWSNIYRAVTSADTITFYTSTVPTINIPLGIKVVR